MRAFIAFFHLLDAGNADRSVKIEKHLILTDSQTVPVLMPDQRGNISSPRKIHQFG